MYVYVYMTYHIIPIYIYLIQSNGKTLLQGKKQGCGGTKKKANDEVSTRESVLDSHGQH